MADKPSTTPTSTTMSSTSAKATSKTDEEQNVPLYHSSADDHRQAALDQTKRLNDEAAAAEAKQNG